MMREDFLDAYYIGTLLNRQRFDECPWCHAMTLIYSLTHGSYCLTCGYPQHSGATAKNSEPSKLLKSFKDKVSKIFGGTNKSQIEDKPEASEAQAVSEVTDVQDIKPQPLKSWI